MLDQDRMMLCLLFRGHLSHDYSLRAIGLAFRGRSIGWLSFHLKNAFKVDMGYLAGAFHKAKSLEAPLQDDEDGDLADIIAGPKEQYEDAEKRIWLEQLRAELDKALATLPEEQAITIRCRYFHGQTLAAIAGEEGVYRETVRQREGLGLRKLRNPKISKRLSQFIEERTPYYLRVGADRFNTTGTSSVEGGSVSPGGVEATG